jgi:putative FmdB family regulatory protein
MTAFLTFTFTPRIGTRVYVSLVRRRHERPYTARVMPTYEYVCRTCGHGFEIVQSMRDEPLTVCDICGGELRKVFTAPAISFKGSGFYATDHGKRKVKEPEKSGEKSGEKKDDKAAVSTSSDSKSSESGSGSKSSDSKPSGSGATTAKKESPKKEATST